MLTTSEIKNQSLKYITEHLQYDNFTDQQIMEAHNWVVEVLLDFEKVYGPSDKLCKSDVLSFLEQYLEHNDELPVPKIAQLVLIVTRDQYLYLIHI